MGCPAVMAVKLKEHPQIHLCFSNYLQPFLIWSDGNVIADKANNDDRDDDDDGELLLWYGWPTTGV